MNVKITRRGTACLELLARFLVNELNQTTLPVPPNPYTLLFHSALCKTLFPWYYSLLFSSLVSPFPFYANPIPKPSFLSSASSNSLMEDLNPSYVRNTSPPAPNHRLTQNRRDTKAPPWSRRLSRQQLKVPPGHVEFRLLCHQSVIGGVIGNNGAVVSQLRRETDTKIHCEKPVPGSDYGIVLVIGSRSGQEDRNRWRRGRWVLEGGGVRLRGVWSSGGHD